METENNILSEETNDENTTQSEITNKGSETQEIPTQSKNADSPKKEIKAEENTATEETDNTTQQESENIVEESEESEE